MDIFLLEAVVDGLLLGGVLALLALAPAASELHPLAADEVEEALRAGRGESDEEKGQ